MQSRTLELLGIHTVSVVQAADETLLCANAVVPGLLTPGIEPPPRSRRLQWIEWQQARGVAPSFRLGEFPVRARRASFVPFGFVDPRPPREVIIQGHRCGGYGDSAPMSRCIASLLAFGCRLFLNGFKSLPRHA